MTTPQVHRLARLAVALADAIAAHDADTAMRLLALIEETRPASSSSPTGIPSDPARGPVAVPRAL